MNQTNNRPESQVAGGQAAVLRDMKKISDLSTKYELKNPDTAFEVYEMLTKQPAYFETSHGKTFQRSLLRIAIRSQYYLKDETSISGRSRIKDQDGPAKVDRQEEKSVTKQVSGKKKWYILALLPLILAMTVVIMIAVF